MESEYKILVVEDNKKLSNLIVQILNKNPQYNAQSVNKLNQARKILKRWYFDLICLDIFLPDGNGIDLCKEIKKSNYHKNTKIIIISKKIQPQYTIEAFNFGADEYVTKPFHPQELEIRVKKQLGLIKNIEANIEFKNIKIDLVNMKFIYGKYELPLTKTEYLLLRYLFEHKGYANLDLLTHFLSSKKIKHVSDKSIVVSINRLRKKLEKSTGNPFIKTKYGAGYYLP